MRFFSIWCSSLSVLIIDNTYVNKSLFITKLLWEKMLSNRARGRTISDSSPNFPHDRNVKKLRIFSISRSTTADTCILWAITEQPQITLRDKVATDDKNRFFSVNFQNFLRSEENFKLNTAIWPFEFGGSSVAAGFGVVPETKNMSYKFALIAQVSRH